MRRGWLVLLVMLAGCSSTIRGAGAPAPYAEAVADGWTNDGDIPGVLALEDLPTTHVPGPVVYQQSPPIGGPHDQSWADCTGRVYDVAIRQENAVHALEHGAVWMTYRPDLEESGIETLTGLIDGLDHSFMSPYPGLGTAVSVQSWGRQLHVDSASDPRVEAFLRIYRLNPSTTPEPGAPCSNPAFAVDPLPPY